MIPEAMTTESLISQINAYKKENSFLRESVSELQEQLAWLKRQIFGQRSEKVVRQANQADLYLEGFEPQESAESKKKQAVPAHERKKPTRNGKETITLPPDLPVERQVIDIPEEEKICKETGQPLVQIGEEVSYKLAHKPGSYFIKEIVRPKYAFPKNSEGGIAIAPMPESLLSRPRSLGQIWWLRGISKCQKDHMGAMLGAYSPKIF
jgi:hypothetical protein